MTSLSPLLSDVLLAEFLNSAKRSGIAQSSKMLRWARACELWREGKWQQAHHCVATDFALIDEPVTRGFSAAVAAFVTGATGSNPNVQDLLVVALEAAATHGQPVIAAWAYAATAHLHVATQRPDLARPYLERVLHISRSVDLNDPYPLLWQGDYLDVLLDLDDRPAANAFVEALEGASGDGPELHWKRGVVARARARIASNETTTDQQFASALTEFGVVNMPFEIARTYLDRGRHFRAERAGACHDLAEAGRIFRDLPAPIWVQTVVEAIGRTDARDESAAYEVGVIAEIQRIEKIFTPAESRVAWLVSAGNNYRQVASELFISAKTVDFHMQSVYRKLRVNSRSEFVVKFLRLTNTSPSS